MREGALWKDHRALARGLATSTRREKLEKFLPARPNLEKKTNLIHINLFIFSFTYIRSTFAFYKNPRYDIKKKIFRSTKFFLV